MSDDWPTILARNALAPLNRRPDNSGLDDGPFLPGQAPRKRSAAKTPEETQAIRAAAWATRRAKWGPRGHR